MPDVESPATRMVRLLKAELQTPARWLWLSYADEKEFLGGAMIKARGITTALIRARALNISPGGDVVCSETPPERAVLVPERFRERLLSWGDVEEMDREISARFHFPED